MNAPEPVRTSPGVERRHQIDNETFKALLAINGGGAVALLALLPQLMPKPELRALTLAVFVGIMLLMLGLVAAVVHNTLRRRCSLIYEQHKMAPPKGKLFGIRLGEPLICTFSWLCMWIGVGTFTTAGFAIAITGFVVLKAIAPAS
jgi:hypothetical protein